MRCSLCLKIDEEDQYFKESKKRKICTYPVHVFHEYRQTLCILYATIVTDDTVMFQCLIQVDFTVKCFNFLHCSRAHCTCFNTLHGHFFACRQITTQEHLAIKHKNKLFFTSIKIIFLFSSVLLSYQSITAQRLNYGFTKTSKCE